MTASNPKTIPARPSSKSRLNHFPVHKLAHLAVEAVQSKKATDIVVMDMRKVSGVADLFVLCTGSSELQVKAIVEAVREHIIEEAGERPWHSEGQESRQWVLLDYVDLVVHVFNEEKRAFYDLERLWGDAPKAEISEDDLLDSIAMLHPDKKNT
jgi:ribosome-associated protein